MARTKWRTLIDLGFAAAVGACAVAASAALDREMASVPMVLALLTLTVSALAFIYGVLHRRSAIPPEAAARDSGQVGQLLDALPVAVLLFGDDGRLLSGNVAWRTFASEHGVPDKAARHPSHYRDFARAFESAHPLGSKPAQLVEGIRSVLMGEGHAFDGEFALASGAHTRRLHLTAHAFECEHGRCVAVLLLDVTDRHVAEERRDLLGAALNASAHAVVITDSRAVIEWANPAFATLAGRAPHETIGRTPAELLRSARDGAAFHPVIWDTIAKGEVWRGELIQQHKDGAMRHESMTITPVRDGGGTLRHFVAIKEDITERKLHERELHRLASTDALTGARNRRVFLENVTLERARVRRYGRRSALLMLDLDHFRQVNEAHGQAAGDAVLRHCVKLASASLRQTDMIGRLGGEEFGILLADTDLEGAIEFGERLRSKVNASAIRHGGVQIRVTVSIGIAGFKREDPHVDAVLARADSALQLAKSGGRNRVECAQAE